MVFLHPYEGRIRVSLAEAVSVTKQRLVLFVLSSLGQVFQFLTAHLARFAEFGEVLSLALPFFLVLCRFNVSKQSMDVLLQFSLVFTHGFPLNERVAIGIGLNLGAVYKVMLQRDVFFVCEKLKDCGKYGFEDVPHSLGTEMVDRAEIRLLPSG